MSGAGHGVALYARGHVGRAGSIPLRLALAELEKSAPAAVADEAFSAAGVALAVYEAFDEARAIGGRAIVDVTFALHTRLGLSHTAPATPYIQLVTLDPYMRWLEPRMAEGSPWRPIIGRWVEVLNERLTLHRYADREHRRRHGRDLLAEPLAALAEIPPSADLINLADLAVAFCDLMDAEELAARGWNRIDLPGADQIGGFYGLADQAHPPELTHVATMAAALADRIQAAPVPTLSPDIDTVATRLCALMREALTTRAAENAWPDWLTRQTTWMETIQTWLRRRNNG